MSRGVLELGYTTQTSIYFSLLVSYLSLAVKFLAVGFLFTLRFKPRTTTKRADYTNTTCLNSVKNTYFYQTRHGHNLHEVVHGTLEKKVETPQR